jgi:putative flippase GtrA
VKSFLLKRKQFLLYCLIGGCGTLLDFSTYTLLLKFSGLGYQVANAIGYAAGTALSFVLNAKFNFRVADKIPLRLLVFFSVALLGWLTSALVLHTLIEHFQLNKIAAKLATLAVIVLLQYNLNRLLSFRKN